MTTTASTSQDLRTRREAVVRASMKAENRHDPAGTVETFHEPRYDVPAMGELGQARGGQAVHDLIASLFAGFPDWHAELNTPLMHTDSGIFAEVRMTGTHQGDFAGIPPTGKSMDVRVATLFEFEDDRLLGERVYFDFATVLRQLGVLPG